MQLSIEQNQRQEVSSRFNNLLNFARSMELLQDNPTSKPQAGSFQTLNIDASGNKTRPNDKHRWLVNKFTGERIAHVGSITTPDNSSGSKVEPDLSDIMKFDKNLREITLTTIFFDEIRQGYRDRFNEDVVSSAELLSILRSGLNPSFDFDTARAMLSPDNQIEFNDLIREGLERLIAGERNIATIRGDLVRKSQNARPGTKGRPMVKVEGFGGEDE